MLFNRHLLAQAGLALTIFSQVQALPQAEVHAHPTPNQPHPTPVKRFGDVAPPAVTLAPRDDSPICIPFADPDHGQDAGCQCSGVTGLVTPLCSTGDDCNPCGYTTTPGEPGPSSVVPFTYTDSTNGDIISCESATTENAAVNTMGACAGSSTIVGTESSIYESYTKSQAVASAASPTTTVQIGLEQINYGELNGQNLTDPLNKALGDICGGTDSGECHGSAGFDSYYQGSYGKLNVNVKQATYANKDQRDAMVAIIVASFVATAQGDKQCKQLHIKKQCPNSNFDQCDAGTVPECYGANFVSSQILHVNPDTHGAEEQATMAVEMTYGNDNPAVFECNSLLGLLGLTVGMIPGGGLVTGATANLLGATSFICKGE